MQQTRGLRTPASTATQRTHPVIFQEELENPDSRNSLSKTLQNNKIDFIILAGFLWKIPEHLIRLWPGKILNIHPALLPQYGGPGMYGDRVHSAVIQNAEKESGITIHVVDPLSDPVTGHLAWKMI